MHVDPLMVRSKVVLDATGHPSEIAKITAQKNNIKLNTVTGMIMGEMSLQLMKVKKYNRKYQRSISWTLCIWYGSKWSVW